MLTPSWSHWPLSWMGAVLVLALLFPLDYVAGANLPEGTEAVPKQAISLADAALRALQNNLDISISRQTKESRLTDIVFEQAKYDPSVSPLNRPILGFGGDQPTPLDQNSFQGTVDMTQNLLTGANFDLNFSPSRVFVAGQQSFLFNPAYQSGLAFTLTQPLLRNFGTDVNKTLILIAQNNAKVEEHVFLDRVLTVIATVEQTFWELVFANENLKVADAAVKAAQELLASNRAKAKAGVMSIVDVLQAEAAVASRVEQTLIAEKTIRDQEDQLRRLMNPGEEELRRDVQLIPQDQPVVTLDAISLQEAIDVAIERRPELLEAGKNIETSDLNAKFARNQLLPNLSVQGTSGLA